MIPALAFDPIISEIQRRQLPINNERKVAGRGRSIAFGIVNKRIRSPDYSRHCRDRSYLYKLLIEFARDHIPETLIWNSIQVNQNYLCSPHTDKGNGGNSLVVGFGDYTGGQLVIEGTEHDIRHNPIIDNFTTNVHWVAPFQGNRYSLVFFHTPVDEQLPPPSVRLINDKYVFFRGDQAIYKTMKEHTKGYKANSNLLLNK